MKRIIFLLLLVLPIITFAQESQLNTFFEKYSGKDGYTSVYITKYMFELFKKIDNAQNESDFKEVATKLNSIKILSVDSVKNVSTNMNFSKELLSVLPKKFYKELMIVKDGSETITFLIREEDSKISEFVMTIDGSSSPVLIFLEGDINLNQMAKLSKTMSISGFEHLDKISDQE